jgi:sugar transferase EpsL
MKPIISYGLCAPSVSVGKINLMPKERLSYPAGKRIFDMLFSMLVGIILSPLIIVISALLLIMQGFPLFFCQDRPGWGGHIFKLCKFRTMRSSPGHENQPDLDEQRITPFGKFLRRASLDELPELFNVLKGEMSIVGPRPLLVQYLDRYSEEQSRRHEMPPGITGWAQINGRNAVSWEERLKMDVWYVDHWSFWLDIRIILISVWKVLSGEGISQPGRATMDEFMGNQKK